MGRIFKKGLVVSDKRGIWLYSQNSKEVKQDLVKIFWEEVRKKMSKLSVVLF